MNKFKRSTVDSEVIRSMFMFKVICYLKPSSYQQQGINWPNRCNKISFSSSPRSIFVFNNNMLLFWHANISFCNELVTTTKAHITSTLPTQASTTSCSDMVDTCTKINRGMCIVYRSWAMNSCRKYCGFCQGLCF